MAVAHDVFGIAAHEQALEAAPPMRAAHDELGRPVIRFGDDEFAGSLADRLDQPAVDFDARRARGRFRFVNERFTGASHLADELLEEVGRGVLCDPGGAVQHVNDPDTRGQTARKLDGLAQCLLCRVAAINGYENVLVHVASTGHAADRVAIIFSARAGAANTYECVAAALRLGFLLFHRQARLAQHSAITGAIEGLEVVSCSR